MLGWTLVRLSSPPLGTVTKQQPPNIFRECLNTRIWPLLRNMVNMWTTQSWSRECAGLARDWLKVQQKTEIDRVGLSWVSEHIARSPWVFPHADSNLRFVFRGCVDVWQGRDQDDKDLVNIMFSHLRPLPSNCAQTFVKDFFWRKEDSNSSITFIQLNEEPCLERRRRRGAKYVRKFLRAAIKRWWQERNICWVSI